MQILIVEDEVMVARHLRRQLVNLLKDQVPSIAHAETLAEASCHLENHPIDLIFVDLNLHGEDGFDILKNASNQTFQTIIVSANTDQALRSYDFDVLDFIAKPVTSDRLKKAVSRFQLKPQNAGTGIGSYVKIRNGCKRQIVPVDQILFISGANKYSEVFLENSFKYLHEKKLWQFMKFLPVRFQRVHKSHIANLDHAERVITASNKQHKLRLKTGQELPVGRSYLSSLLARFD